VFGFFLKSNAQTDKSECPKVNVTVKLSRDTFKFGNDIPVLITLTNKAKSTQSVWFDRPKSSTGGPPWTSVMLTNKKTGRSVLRYQNKAILQSQLYSTEQVKKYSYKLKPGQKVSGKFSLYELVVLLDDKDNLDKGNYEMKIFYCNNGSSKINFTVD
jgi:hypothetical protein